MNPLHLLPLLLAGPVLAQDVDAPVRAGPAPYLRLVEEQDGLRLEVAVRRFLFAREGRPGTVVSLVGVLHVADEAYYDTLQAQLDGQGVVLFEQVVDEEADAVLAGVSPTDRARVAATRRRLGTLLAAAVRHRRETGQAPPTVGALLRATPDARRLRRFTRAAQDAWGRPLVLESIGPDRALLRAASLGADGEPGGAGVDADLSLSEREAPPFEAQGLQKDLADALGLVFQLEGLDYAGASWRRSDVTLSELRTLLRERGAEAEGLLSALQGGSLLESLASGMLKLFGATRSGRGVLKLVGIEALARADELLARPPAGFEALFDVLLTRRNDVVLADLRALLADEPQHQRVAVLYGAGHMADLAARLREELGLTALDESWLPALDLRFADTGLSRSQIALLRRTIGKAIDDQLAASRRAEDKER